MPDTFQALAVFLLALLPGSLYVWSFERVAGNWGMGLSDRVLRFIGVSAIFHAIAAPATLHLWRGYVRSGRLLNAPLPLWLWGIALAYVAIPIVAGTLVGRGTRERKGWAKIFTGPAPAPRAWDDLFGSRPEGWFRLRMKSGVWIGGLFANDEAAGLRSYAAGYPEDQDLHFTTVGVDSESGEFILDERGQPQMAGSGILVRWDEVEYMEFTFITEVDDGQDSEANV